MHGQGAGRPAWLRTMLLLVLVAVAISMGPAMGPGQLPRHHNGNILGVHAEAQVVAPHDNREAAHGGNSGDTRTEKDKEAQVANASVRIDLSTPAVGENMCAHDALDVRWRFRLTPPPGPQSVTGHDWWRPSQFVIVATAPGVEQQLILPLDLPPPCHHPQSERRIKTTDNGLDFGAEQTEDEETRSGAEILRRAPQSTTSMPPLYIQCVLDTEFCVPAVKTLTASTERETLEIGFEDDTTMPQLLRASDVMQALHLTPALRGSAVGVWKDAKNLIVHVTAGYVQEILDAYQAGRFHVSVRKVVPTALDAAPAADGDADGQPAPACIEADRVSGSYEFEGSHRVRFMEPGPAALAVFNMDENVQVPGDTLRLYVGACDEVRLSFSGHNVHLHQQENAAAAAQHHHFVHTPAQREQPAKLALVDYVPTEQRLLPARPDIAYRGVLTCSGSVSSLNFERTALPNQENGSWSLSAWVMPVPHEGGPQTLLHRNDLSENGTTRGIGVWRDDDTGQLLLRVATPTNPSLGANSHQSVPTWSWTHIAIVFSNMSLAKITGQQNDRDTADDGTSNSNSEPSSVFSWRVYLNGSLDVEATYSEPVEASEAPVQLCAPTSTNSGMRGMLSHLRLWGGALSPVAIRNDHDITRSAFVFNSSQGNSRHHASTRRALLTAITQSIHSDFANPLRTTLLSQRELEDQRSQIVTMLLGDPDEFYAAPQSPDRQEHVDAAESNVKGFWKVAEPTGTSVSQSDIPPPDIPSASSERGVGDAGVCEVRSVAGVCQSLHRFPWHVDELHADATSIAKLVGTASSPEEVHALRAAAFEASDRCDPWAMRFDQYAECAELGDASCMFRLARMLILHSEGAEVDCDNEHGSDPSQPDFDENDQPPTEVSSDSSSAADAADPLAAEEATLPQVPEPAQRLVESSFARVSRWVTGGWGVHWFSQRRSSLEDGATHHALALAQGVRLLHAAAALGSSDAASLLSMLEFNGISTMNSAAAVDGERRTTVDANGNVSASTNTSADATAQQSVTAVRSLAAALPDCAADTTVARLHWAALGGSQDAALALSHRYKYGLLVPKDVSTAVHYALIAAENAEHLYNTFGKEPYHEMHRIDEWTVTDVDKGQRGEADERIQYHLLRANEGDVPSMLQAGDMYYFGTSGMPRDQALARSMYLRAANANSPVGQSLAAAMLIKGEGGPKNTSHALELYEAAAEQDNVRALNGLGYLYFMGSEVDKNQTKAFELFMRAANQGKTGDSFFNAGYCLLHGLGVERDPVQAYQLFKHSATTFGYFASILQAGKMALQGLGTPRSPSDAMAFLVPAAQKGKWGSLLRHAFDEFLENDMLGATLLYIEASEYGYEVGSSNAAFLVETHRDRMDAVRTAVLGGSGADVSFPRPEDLALRMHTMAWLQGRPDPLVPIALAMLRPDSVLPQNPAQALRWLSKGSAEGVARAALLAGNLVEYGALDGVEENCPRAARYYARAISLWGDRDIRMLGHISTWWLGFKMSLAANPAAGSHPATLGSGHHRSGGAGHLPGNPALQLHLYDNQTLHCSSNFAERGLWLLSDIDSKRHQWLYALDGEVVRELREQLANKTRAALAALDRAATAVLVQVPGVDPSSPKVAGYSPLLVLAVATLAVTSMAVCAMLTACCQRRNLLRPRRRAVPPLRPAQQRPAPTQPEPPSPRPEQSQPELERIGGGGGASGGGDATQGPDSETEE